MTEEEVSRFLAKIKVDPETSCAEWTGARSSAGEGKMRSGGTVELPHRLAYSQRLGSINHPPAIARGRASLHNPHFSEVCREEKAAASRHSQFLGGADPVDSNAIPRRRRTGAR